MNRRLFFIVIVGHLLFFLVFTTKTKRHSRKEKIIVKEILLRKTPPPSILSPPAAYQAPLAIAKSKPKIKEQPQKTPPLPTKKSTDQLAKMMRESLATLDKPKQSADTTPLNMEKVTSQTLTDQDYRQEIALYLQELLTLPEPGEARVSLTLSRDGIVLNVALKSCSSERNKAYILARLPEVFFPHFGPFFKSEKQHTFLLTLNSD